MEQKYYFFYLEIALRDKLDTRIYAYENVSHIPTKKLVEIFNVNLKKDPYILEGYLLTKTIFSKHREFIEKHIGPVNLDMFEYCLRQYVANDYKAIRKLYKEDLME